MAPASAKKKTAPKPEPQRTTPADLLTVESVLDDDKTTILDELDEGLDQLVHMVEGYGIDVVGEVVKQGLAAKFPEAPVYRGLIEDSEAEASDEEGEATTTPSKKLVAARRARAVTVKEEENDEDAAEATTPSARKKKAPATKKNSAKPMPAGVRATRAGKRKRDD